MRPSISSSILVFLLVLHFLLCGAYGARLGKFGLTSSSPQQANLNNDKDMKKDESNNKNNVQKAGVVCKDEDHCISTKGKTRKLITSTTLTTSSTVKPIQKNVENNGAYRDDLRRGDKYQNSSSSSSSSSVAKPEKHDDDTIDMTEMDYSPAMRKPPIHN